MLNNNDDENLHDYFPNELATLSIKNPDKYREIVQSNLERGDTIEKWEQRNLEHMQKYLYR